MPRNYNHIGKYVKEIIDLKSKEVILREIGLN